MSRRRAFLRNAFFTRLSSEDLPDEERLGFLPAMAHFILSFGDLNRYVLRYAEPRTALEHAVNEHTQEDANHWPWYLADLRALGYDEQGSRTRWLLDCWSEETKAARQLTYTLVQLISGTPAQERIALIEVMEETGNAVFSALAPIAARIEKTRGVKLQFCGQHHLDRESGHTLSLDHGALAAIDLTPSARAAVIAKVDTAFDAFEEFLLACAGYAQQRWTSTTSACAAGAQQPS